MSSAAIQPRLRPDLFCRAIRVGKAFQWVIRDPLVSVRGSNDRASAQWMVNAQEFAILKSLDGHRTFEQAHLHCQRLLAPTELSQEDFEAFVNQAHRNAWITAASATNSLCTPQREWGTRRREPDASFWRRAFRNPLAIRVPLVDPDRWLDRPVQRARALVRKHRQSVVLAGSAWAVLTGVTLLANWEHLVPAVQQSALTLQSPSTWIVLAVVISGIKLIHELAHAIACKWFGGHCHELGVMLLFGIPCLYCDVSDAWLIPQPWKRMLVSAAGILTECALGSLALIAWAHSMPGLPQNILLFVLMVTSVNTLILNGNPLMRYDGYYLLSDAVSVPNLASRSRAALQLRLRSWFWGASSIRNESESHPTAMQHDRDSIGMLTFAVASTLYRLLVFGTIGWLVLHFLASIGATAVGLVAIAIILYRVLQTWTASIVRPPSEVDPVTARGRSRMMFGVVAAVLLALLFTPLPHCLNATAKIQPAHQTEVFALAAGRLESVAEAGHPIQANERVAKLVDWRSAFQTQRLEGEIAELKARLQGTRMGRASSRADQQPSTNIPTIEFALQAKLEELATVQKESEHREIRASHAGRIVTVTPKPITPWQRSRSQIDWSGQPTEAINRGAWISSGTPICQIVSDAAYNVSVPIAASQIEWVREGQTAVTSFPHGASWNGVVTQVGTRPSEQDGTYEVTITLDPDNRPFDFAPPSNWTTDVMIHVEATSLWGRTRHWVATHFRADG
ncbi:HlyD family efflux transporter periplasmic adaptor subunit [Rhodopirellula sp. P2]|uniref:HlyD family efflux transporter periplasmic adaptor subunit n=1 Tax=Rhodopirellula sp. P2 TaxID=2127060 RepID=UPI002368EB47|nr:HlyD family efflux transporter periplasmic adaptor subunit [Rhodopirellula sp. P2]WDQ17919.1 HlyD family efflux transporter periplasmic adaptor subunit [Rhodopirellula sp. P2]